MTLKGTDLQWAIEFVARHGDGDLFPRVLEFGPIQREPSKFIKLVEGKDLAAIPPAPHRRFIVPKDDISYRTATQLHPQDSILLTALLYAHGQGIEDRRRPKNEVFSYRFSPDPNLGFYGRESSWNEFWTQAAGAAASAHTVLQCDIADFYNQIYHHTLENQLIESGFPNQATKWIIKLFESTTAGVSRGTPIGPHAVHLLAEATMIPIDNSLRASGLNMLRYADDMLFFCDSKKDARLALAQVSSTLDKQQRLILQRHKTRFFPGAPFSGLCERMVEDRPISESEDEILQIIGKYSGGDPYQTISFNQISDEDWRVLDSDVIRDIILEYLSASDIDYIRLRWFYRRLTQVGHPGAIDVSLQHMALLGPCFANICTYLASAQTIPSTKWKDIGGSVLRLLDSEEVRASPYFRLSLLSLFTRNHHMNHFASLVQRFESGDGDVRREVLLAAWTHDSVDWVREKKEDYGRMDPWQQLAFIASCSNLPADERKYLLNSLALDRPFEVALAAIVKKG